MTDPGLTNRLRQRSRRAGLMIGLTMAVTIAICLGGFVWIYAELNPFTSDFVGVDPPDNADASENPTRTPRSGGSDAAAEDGDEDDAQPTEEPTEEAEPTPTSTAFEATHLSNPAFQINFRSGPTTNSDAPFGALEPGTPLRFLGDEELDENGENWMHFETEDGREGWMREIDTVEAQ